MATKKQQAIDMVRAALRQALEDSELTQEEVGVRMGFDKSGARTAVSRLTNPKVKHDPRLSTLLAFSQAIHRPLTDLLK